MRSIGLMALLCFLVSGCAADLKPLNDLSFTTGPNPCPKKSGLDQSICQAHRKSEQLSDAHFKLWNNPALFDAPLLALASTAAGLLLFDAGTDSLKGVGLAAASITAGRSYANPTEIRAALRNGSDGYACLADAGELVREEESKVLGLGSTRDQLLHERADLIRAFSDPAAGFTDIAHAREAAANAKSAIDLYNKQADSSRFANITIRSKARALSNGLLKRIERNQIDFSALYQSIAQQASNTVSNQSTRTQAQPSGASIAPPPPLGAVASRSFGDQLVIDVEQSTNALLKVPDIETAIARFDNCIVNSLAGSDNNP